MYSSLGPSPCLRWIQSTQHIRPTDGRGMRRALARSSVFGILCSSVSMRNAFSRNIEAWILGIGGTFYSSILLVPFLPLFLFCYRTASWGVRNTLESYRMDLYIAEVRVTLSSSSGRELSNWSKYWSDGLRKIRGVKKNSTSCVLKATVVPTVTWS